MDGIAPHPQPLPHGSSLSSPGSARACPRHLGGPLELQFPDVLPPWVIPQGALFWDSGLGCNHASPGRGPQTCYRNVASPAPIPVLLDLWDAFVLVLGLP